MKDIIIPADKKYRRRRLIFLVLGMVIGGLIIGYGLPGFMAAMEQAESQTAYPHFLIAILIIMFLSLIPFALYLLSIGKLIIKSERFPPPGIRVIRDTRLVVGEKAKTRGRAIIFFSIMLIVMALWGIMTVYRLFHFMSNW